MLLSSGLKIKSSSSVKMNIQILKIVNTQTNVKENAEDVPRGSGYKQTFLILFLTGLLIKDLKLKCMVFGKPYLKMGNN